MNHSSHSHSHNHNHNNNSSLMSTHRRNVGSYTTTQKRKSRFRAMKRRETKQMKREVATISASTPIPESLQDKAKAMMTIVEELSTGSKMKDNQYLTMMNILMDIYKRDVPVDRERVLPMYIEIRPESRNESINRYMSDALHYSSVFFDH